MATALASPGKYHHCGEHPRSKCSEKQAHSSATRQWMLIHCNIGVQTRCCCCSHHYRSQRRRTVASTSQPINSASSTMLQANGQCSVFRQAQDILTRTSPVTGRQCDRRVEYRRLKTRLPDCWPRCRVQHRCMKRHGYQPRRFYLAWLWQFGSSNRQAKHLPINPVAARLRGVLVLNVSVIP